MIRRYSFLFALIFSLIFAPFAHAEWVPQFSSEVHDLLLSITSPSEDHYIVTGSNGSILMSSDGGSTWVERDSTTTADLHGVSAASDERVFAAGSSGTTLRSIDGGETWVEQSNATSQDLYDIDMATESIGTAVGKQGTVLTTSNSGITWTTRVPEIQSDLYAVYHKNNSTIWAVGSGGKIIFSTDQGATWNTRVNDTAETLYDIVFTTNLHAFIVGANGTLVYTEDGGNSWMDNHDVADIALGRNLHAISAFDENHLLIVGEEIILYSNDGGVTWSEEVYTNSLASFYDALNTGLESGLSVGIDANGGFVDVLDLDYETPVEETPVEEDPSTGQLIKTVCASDAGVNDPCRAVYYYGEDGKRHAFPNEKTYFTWYDDFDAVTEIADSTMSAISLGKNVTYRPGVKMVKFVTVNTVYAVGDGGMLRAVATENVAFDLYGSNWNTQIDDISDAFYGNYLFSTPIEDASQYSIEDALNNHTTIDDVL